MGRPLQAAEDENSSISAPVNDPGHPAHNAIHGIVEVGGVNTQVLVQPYDDCIFIAVTQNDRLGTMLSAEVDTVIGGTDSYAITVLMGKRDEMVLELLARRVAGEMVAAGCRKKLLLSVALRQHNLSEVEPLVQAVVQHRGW